MNIFLEPEERHRRIRSTSPPDNSAPLSSRQLHIRRYIMSIDYLLHESPVGYAVRATSSIRRAPAATC
jgi:hypothetical protein